MSTKLDFIDQSSIRSDIPQFRPGDTVKVNVKVIEGNRSRIQAFQGVVISRSGAGVHETFTVRKISFGVGVERKFPLHAPSVDSIEVVSLGDVRRAKLYYLRDLAGKKARIRERRVNVVETADSGKVAEKAVDQKVDQKPDQKDAEEKSVEDVAKTSETANTETVSETTTEATTEATSTEEVKAEQPKDELENKSENDNSDGDNEKANESADADANSDNNADNNDEAKTDNSEESK